MLGLFAGRGLSGAGAGLSTWTTRATRAGISTWAGVSARAVFPTGAIAAAGAGSLRLLGFTTPTHTTRPAWARWSTGAVFAARTSLPGATTCSAPTGLITGASLPTRASFRTLAGRAAGTGRRLGVLRTGKCNRTEAEGNHRQIRIEYLRKHTSLSSKKRVLEGTRRKRPKRFVGGRGRSIISARYSRGFAGGASKAEASGNRARSNR